MPADNTDDWWNSASPIWLETPPTDKMEYRIMRAQKTATTGSPGFVIQWKVWQTFSTLAARDTAIKALVKAHPKWRLKATQGNPYLERLGGTLPVSGINIEGK
jgi:hypothetical protein